MKKWTAINSQDGNDTFEVYGETWAEAASNALLQLGWGLSPDDDDEWLSPDEGKDVIECVTTGIFRILENNGNCELGFALDDDGNELTFETEEEAEEWADENCAFDWKIIMR